MEWGITFHSHAFLPSPLFNQNYPLALVKVLHICCTNTMHRVNDTDMHTQVIRKLVYFKTYRDNINYPCRYYPKKLIK